MEYDESTYLPRLAEIVSVREETPDTKTFSLNMRDGGLEYRPGQFVELSIFGYGEAPISVTSSPTGEHLELCVRAVGRLTRQMHALGCGDIVGIRGPYGNYFPIEDYSGKDILFVGGGIGLAPLRSLILHTIENREQFRGIKIVYGARTPADRVFKDELDQWPKMEGVEVCNCVDRDDKSCPFQGEVCLVTKLLAKQKIDPPNTVAYVCGPPIMIKFTNQELLRMGLAEDRIVMTMERMMKCGVGKCGHCNIAGKYVCLDGPVFTYREMKELPHDE